MIQKLITWFETQRERREIIRNARAAHKAGLIDKWQKWDVYRMVAADVAEREVK